MLADYTFLCVKEQTVTQSKKGKDDKPEWEERKYKPGDKVSLLALAGINGVWEQERTDKQGNKNSITCYKHFVFELVFRMAGLSVVSRKWEQLGSTDNGFTYLREYVIEGQGKRGWAIGEANPQQARTQVGLTYMADKRAYDRAVIDWLGAVDVFSEIENEALENQETSKPTIEQLSPAERKLIAPNVQKIANVKSTEELEAVGEEIKTWKQELEQEYKDKGKQDKFPTKAFEVLKEIYSTKLIDLRGLDAKNKGNGKKPSKKPAKPKNNKGGKKGDKKEA